MRNTTPESLSEHTAEVAAVAHCLALIGNRIYKKSYNPDRACLIALYHDAAEVYTGDLPTPIKYFSEKTREDYGEIEQQAVSTLLSRLPSELREDYLSILGEGAGEDCEERRLVHIADKLCAYIKCITEEASGNREFISARKATEKKLDDIDSEELRYFREHFLPSFSLTIDEM